MRCLITGGGGFVGLNLVNYMLERGYEVGVLIRRESGTHRVSKLEGKATFVWGDITDLTSIDEGISSFKPDFIFHLATYGAFPKMQTDFKRMVDVNVKGTHNLVSAAMEIPIINSGSSSEYGIKEKPMSEGDLCDPIMEYGLSKLAQTLYCRKHQIPTLRLFSVYGPYESETRLIPSLLNAALSEKKINLIRSVRDYIYADDVARAFLLAAERYESIRGEIFNIGSGIQTSMESLVGAVNKIIPKKLNVTWNFKEVQKEPFSWVADITKARFLLNWGPHFNLLDGLTATCNWRRN